MSLEQVTHIEGLDNAFELSDMPDDTHPDAKIIKFKTEVEEMPFLTAQKGEVVRKTFVWIVKEWDLGRAKVMRRIRDTVEYDKKEGRWKVLKLAQPSSDIRRYPEAWNGFARGNTDEILGTPIAVIFKADPARAEHYKMRHTNTVEQLADQPQGTIDDLGMGAGDDQRRARAYLEHLKKNAPIVQVQSQLEEKDRQIAGLMDQVTELSERLTDLLDAPKKRAKTGRPRKADLQKEQEDKEALQVSVQRAKDKLLTKANESLAETVEGL